MPDTPIDQSNSIQSVRLKVPTGTVPVPPVGFGQLHTPSPGVLALRLPDGSVTQVGPAPSGSGAGVEVYGVAVPEGNTVVFSLDPTDTAHVAEYFRHGVTLNTAKNAYVLDRPGRWLALGNVRLAQHATAWLGVTLFTPSDGESPVVSIPPISVIDMTSFAGGMTVEFSGLIERDEGAEVGYGVFVLGGDTTLADSYLKLTYVGPKTGLS